ncbi:MAG: hypothetical protein E7672_05860 [Ruminococcaceae bacterium]|nr:hypothetical protein [Oscillospiraceae bacterium]
MKFSVFTDLHHYPGVFMGGTKEDLDFIEKRAISEKCSFVIHAGDFSHAPCRAHDYIARYKSFKIPTYHCFGNHDTDRTPYWETLRLYGLERSYYYFDCEGYRFVVCDPNFFRLDGEYIHFELMNYYRYEVRDYIPPKQIEWLRETIRSSPLPCVLISHQSFERPDGVQNRDEVLEIINNANKKKKHSVILCINGHYHRNSIRVIDDVCYLDLNSASYDWVNKKHDKFPSELCKKYTLLSNTVVYNDPIHAVITLDESSITINGMESSMFMGINREHTGNEIYDAAGRPVVPRIDSAKIMLD